MKEHSAQHLGPSCRQSRKNGNSTWLKNLESLLPAYIPTLGYVCVYYTQIQCSEQDTYMYYTSLSYSTGQGKLKHYLQKSKYTYVPREVRTGLKVEEQASRITIERSRDNFTHSQSVNEIVLSTCESWRALEHLQHVAMTLLITQYLNYVPLTMSTVMRLRLLTRRWCLLTIACDCWLWAGTVKTDIHKAKHTACFVSTPTYTREQNMRWTRATVMFPPAHTVHSSAASCLAPCAQRTRALTV